MTLKATAWQRKASCYYQASSAHKTHNKKHYTVLKIKSSIKGSRICTAVKLSILWILAANICTASEKKWSHAKLQLCIQLQKNDSTLKTKKEKGTSPVLLEKKLKREKEEWARRKTREMFGDFSAQSWNKLLHSVILWNAFERSGCTVSSPPAFLDSKTHHSADKEGGGKNGTFKKHEIVLVSLPSVFLLPFHEFYYFSAPPALHCSRAYQLT